MSKFVNASAAGVLRAFSTRRESCARASSTHSSLRAARVRWLLAHLLALAGMCAVQGIAMGQAEKPVANAITKEAPKQKVAGITVAQLNALPERVIVQAGLQTVRGKLVSIDDREVRFVESLAGSASGSLIDELDVMIAGLSLEGDLADGGKQLVEASLIRTIPRQDVLAIVPVTAAVSGTGLWAYAPGRALFATNNAPERDARRLQAAAFASRLAQLSRLARQRGGDDAPQEPAPPPSRVASGSLLLTDGQLLSGGLLLALPQNDDIEVAPPKADTLLWQSPVLVEKDPDQASNQEKSVVVPLDAVRTVDVFSTSRERASDASIARTAGQAAQDRIELRNGDVLYGFATTEWKDGTFRVLIESDAGETTSVPGDRVQRIDIADEAQTETSQSNDTMVWVADQTLRAKSIAIENDSALLVWAGVAGGEKSGKIMRMGASSIRAAAFAGDRIFGLASLPVVSVRCGEGRRWCPGMVVGSSVSAPLGAGDVELPGPMAVTLKLPPRAITFACLAELPESCHELGSCEFVVLAGEKELARVKLDAASPVQYVRVQLPSQPAQAARELTLKLDAGPDGNVQDRVVLRSGFIEGAQN